MNRQINAVIPAPKSCRVCSLPKNPEDFHSVTNKVGKKYYHKTCRLCYQKEIQTKRYMKSFGLTMKEVQALGNACNICGATSVKLCVDHNHITNKVRGRLCDRCNRGIGMLGDTPESVMAAAIYLQKNH